MDERFIPLASLVTAARLPAVAAVAPAVPVVPAAPIVTNAFLDPVSAGVVRELALMRVAASEAFERATTDLLARLASDVLARELALAPVDVTEIARAAIAAFAAYEPVALVVASGEFATLPTPLAVRVDGSLEPGDVFVEVRDGAFESRYALRVRDAVAAAAAAAAATVGATL